MTEVVENPTGRWRLGLAAVLGLAALAPGGAAAGPFRIVTDGPESVWVLDAGSGELTWCRLVAPSGPEVLDVAGADVQARPATPRRSRPLCSVALRPAPSDDRGRILDLFGYSSADEAGYGSDGYGSDGYGIDAVDISDRRVLIVRPRRIDINLY
jgi:hypothetical protein